MGTRGYSAVGLHSPKNSLNVGSALRAAGCYGAAMVAVSGVRPQRYLGRIATDTHKAFRHLPLIACDDLHAIIPYDCVPVAVELVDGAKCLFDYKHPERAFYVFGPEDGTLGKATLDWCRDVVYVPMQEHRCMNLAATVNVVLYDRAMKQGAVYPHD
jgi:tRNA(Leu) C34 or U34 (ribose-2'-O)-methylase TrmL